LRFYETCGKKTEILPLPFCKKPTRMRGGKKEQRTKSDTTTERNPEFQPSLARRKGGEGIPTGGRMGEESI
jgi:hypothetical protein